MQNNTFISRIDTVCVENPSPTEESRRQSYEQAYAAGRADAFREAAEIARYHEAASQRYTYNLSASSTAGRIAIAIEQAAAKE